MEKREAAILIRMSETELAQIRERMEEFGTTNMSAFIRKMAIDGYIVKLELPELKEMKRTAVLINTARGGIVNEMALYEALKSGHLNGAAMDVVESEPMTPDHPLLSLDNVVVTPHIAMYSKEAINAVSLICAENVVACLTGGQMINRVV